MQATLFLKQKTTQKQTLLPRYSSVKLQSLKVHGKALTIVRVLITL